jgi:polar amino acid transport system substrate-binding protein
MLGHNRIIVLLTALVCLSAAIDPAAIWSQVPKSAVPASHPPATGTVAARTNIDKLAAIERSGRLRVGVSEIVPWAMHDKNGNWVGFEIDVARKLARDMGVKVEFYPTPLHYLIPDLLAGRTDIIIAGLSIEADRALRVNFSAPYNSTPVTLAANTKRSANRTTLEQFNQSDVIVGALAGSTAEEMTSAMLPNARIRVYDQDSDLFNDLIAGKLDAAAADSPRPELVAKLFSSDVFFPPIKPLASFPAAFAVQRGDMDFVNYLNSWIAARSDNGWLEGRRDYWFKTMDWGKDL